MRNLLFALCLFFSGTILYGQEEIVVLQSSGKVQFLPASQAEAQPVYPGARLAINGKVKLSSGASVKLLYSGATYPLKGGKTYLLSEVVKQNNGKSGIGFTSRFWDFISGSMKETQNEKQLVENHRRYMEAVRAGVKGYTQKEYALRSARHLEGKLGPGTVQFSWSAPEGIQSFLFSLRQNIDDRVILSAWVRDTVFRIDLSQLALTPGESYLWNVSASAEMKDTPRSADHEFVFDPGAGEVLSRLSENPAYQDAAPAEKRLMEAYMLEEAEFYYAADRVYADAAKAFSGNLLIRDTRAAFLSRMDRLGEARTILQQN